MNRAYFGHGDGFWTVTVDNVTYYSTSNVTIENRDNLVEAQMAAFSVLYDDNSSVEDLKSATTTLESEINAFLEALINVDNSIENK